ncbi:MAG: hypothetical protein EON59_08830 [Alphaproteobacteria bacterium]|nr:MAG: hypothetical protein EON59_08830 [Alphaproteobacteria bacterium]
MVLSDAEIEKRLPVWHALSEVFLDTKLVDGDYAEIAAALRNSAYSHGTLRQILEEEVASAFVGNLLDVAGEWTSWTEEEVREIMLRSLRQGRRVPPMWWLKKRMYQRYVRDQWAKIGSLL